MEFAVVEVQITNLNFTRGSSTILIAIFSSSCLMHFANQVTVGRIRRLRRIQQSVNRVYLRKNNARQNVQQQYAQGNDHTPAQASCCHSANGLIANLKTSPAGWRSAASCPCSRTGWRRSKQQRRGFTSNTGNRQQDTVMIPDTDAFSVIAAIIFHFAYPAHKPLHAGCPAPVSACSGGADNNRHLQQRQRNHARPAEKCSICATTMV